MKLMLILKFIREIWSIKAFLFEILFSHSPLRLFAPVVMITNILFRQSVKSKSTPTTQQSSSPKKQTRITEPATRR